MQKLFHILIGLCLLVYAIGSLVFVFGQAICLIAGSMASYALTRTQIRFKTTFLVFVLAISLLPTITLINPIFKLYSRLGIAHAEVVFR